MKIFFKTLAVLWVLAVFFAALERTHGNIPLSLVMALFVPAIILACCYSRPPQGC
jgi:hypothetical protein